MTEDQALALSQQIDRLMAQMKTLEARLAALEQPPPPIPLIAAAVAAYLGHTPKIRQIRLLNRGDWSQQGRAYLQASHDLPKGH